MKRFFILSILIFCLIANSVVFADNNLSAEQKIEELQKLGIVHCYEDGNFYPERYITRAEFCKMVSIICGAKEYSEKTNHFYDVSSEHWANKYISFCLDNKFINGVSEAEKIYFVDTDENGNEIGRTELIKIDEIAEMYGGSADPDNRFAPDENIIYQDAIKIIVTALGYRVSAESAVLSPDPYPNGYLMVAAQLGLLSGKNAKGTDFMTRADAADIIYDALFIPLLVEREDIGGIAYYPADGEDGRELQTLYTKHFEIKE